MIHCSTPVFFSPYFEKLDLKFVASASKTQPITYFCLVLLQVPKYFGLVQTFCTRPKIHLNIARPKDGLHLINSVFVSAHFFSSGTKCNLILGLARDTTETIESGTLCITDLFQNKSVAYL